MDNVVFLIFRRMRAPLLWLVCVYAVAVLGLTLIPGQDGAGNVWRMDFFHALYFVSYMSTTIGFGEIPYEFTDAQRMWVMCCIYLTVVVWIYAIGTVLSLLQDATFRQAITEHRFARRISHLREPFYLVCGYGETGSALVHALTDRDQQAVAIDIAQDRVNVLQLQNLRRYVPALCGDAGRPVHLQEAGLRHPLCAGVVALTNVNEVNLKIAITAKLLHPEVTVICRADSHDVEENMASFGTDNIYDPFDTFGLHLATVLQSPCLYLLHEWLTGVGGRTLPVPVFPPRTGLWILCGFGRFGKAVYERLQDEGLEVVVIEAKPQLTGMPEKGRLVVGRGTEAVTLEEADIQRAVGLVVGTDDDVNNLSVILTARMLNSGLFIVARQNQLDNQELFDEVRADMIMHPSSIVANKIRVLLGTPMLSVFESLALHNDDSWACQLISRIVGMMGDEAFAGLEGGSEDAQTREALYSLCDQEVCQPYVWEVEISAPGALAVDRALEKGDVITLGELIRDPRDRESTLPCIPLMLARGHHKVLLPNPETRVKLADKILFCGRHSAEARMSWTLQNLHALNYVVTGDSRPQGAVWRFVERLSRRRG